MDRLNHTTALAKSAMAPLKDISGLLGNLPVIIMQLDMCEGYRVREPAAELVAGIARAESLILSGWNHGLSVAYYNCSQVVRAVGLCNWRN